MESGPTTKVCQYNHQKFWKCTSFWGFADIASVVWWFIGRFLAAWSVVRFLVRWISETTIASIWFYEEILEIWKNANHKSLWFSEFLKIRIENFINSNYSNYSQKFANSSNSNFWSTDQYGQMSIRSGLIKQNMKVIIFQNNIHVSKVHCGSAVRFGQALPGFLITAHHLYASLP